MYSEAEFFDVCEWLMNELDMSFEQDRYKLFWHSWSCVNELDANRTARIRHQCRKTTALSCHRSLINTGVEKMNCISIQIRTLTTRCLRVSVNVGIQAKVYTFENAVFHCEWYGHEICGLKI